MKSPRHCCPCGTIWPADLAHRPHHHRTYGDYWQRTLGLDAAGWQRQITRSHEHVALVESALFEVLQTIARQGLDRNTVIIFTADHGDAVGSNGGSMNKGGLMVEETLRVPLVVSGTTPMIKGGVCSRPVSNMDIHPTILELCGITAPVVADGRSLLPLLRDPDRQEWRSHLILEHFGLHEPLTQRALVEERFKYILQSDGFGELYDILTDPCELHNLAASRRHTKVLYRMRRALIDTLRRFDDTSARNMPLLNVLEKKKC